MGSLGIRDENLGKFWSRSWDGAKMWMASLPISYRSGNYTFILVKEVTTANPHD